MSFFIVELISVLVSTLFTLFELLGYNGNKGHVFTKKPDLAFWVLTAISGIKFYFFNALFKEIVDSTQKRTVKTEIVSMIYL